MASCSAPGICSCVSEHSASTPCADISLSTDMFSPGHHAYRNPVRLVEDPASSVPESARAILKVLIDTFNALDAQIRELDAEINRRSKTDPAARRLMTIPGVGPIAATAITALVPAPENFGTGRDSRLGSG